MSTPPTIVYARCISCGEFEGLEEVKYTIYTVYRCLTCRHDAPSHGTLLDPYVCLCGDSWVNSTTPTKMECYRQCGVVVRSNILLQARLQAQARSNAASLAPAASTPAAVHPTNTVSRVAYCFGCSMYEEWFPCSGTEAIHSCKIGKIREKMYSLAQRYLNSTFCAMCKSPWQFQASTNCLVCIQGHLVTYARWIKAPSKLTTAVLAGAAASTPATSTTPAPTPATNATPVTTLSPGPRLNYECQVCGHECKHGEKYVCFYCAKAINVPSPLPRGKCSSCRVSRAVTTYNFQFQCYDCFYKSVLIKYSVTLAPPIPFVPPGTIIHGSATSLGAKSNYACQATGFVFNPQPTPPASPPRPKRPGMQPCATCGVERSPELDAYWGKDKYLVQLCSKCRSGR